MAPNTTTSDREVTMSTFTATVSASTEADALAKVERYLAKCEGFTTTGRTGVRSERHMLRTVEVACPQGVTKAQRNNAWVILTSYGISPSEDLGSVWQTVVGVGC